MDPGRKDHKSGAWLDIWKVDDSRNTAFEKIIIEGIDMDEVVRHYSGSVEDYLELLSLYCLDGKRKISVLRELWEKRDYRSYGIEVHGLKSASANVGAMGVSTHAREHEEAVDRGMRRLSTSMYASCWRSTKHRSAIFPVSLQTAGSPGMKTGRRARSRRKTWRGRSGRHWRIWRISARKSAPAGLRHCWNAS